MVAAWFQLEHLSLRQGVDQNWPHAIADCQPGKIAKKRTVNNKQDHPKVVLPCMPSLQPARETTCEQLQLRQHDFRPFLHDFAQGRFDGFPQSAFGITLGLW